MVNVILTVEEIFYLTGQLYCGGGLSGEIINKCQKAIETNLQLTGTAKLTVESVGTKNYLQMVKCFRESSGSGLLQAKNFLDVVRGVASYNNITGQNDYYGGKPNSCELPYLICKKIAHELENLGATVKVERLDS